MKSKSFNEKLIIALDVPEISTAKKLVEEIGEEGVFYKIGLELMMSDSYFELTSWLKNRGKKIFADLKLYDISETVGRAVANLSKHEIDLLTIHAASRSIMEQAARNKGAMQVIGVTILTNLDQRDLGEMGFDPQISLQDLVIKKAALALESGLDGVVASALEAKNLRQNFGEDFLIVTPGIRLEAFSGDDQKRVADVATALKNGASHLVVGRPITRADNPKIAARRFHEVIADTIANQN